jgi:hypothetical protein
MRTGQKGAFPGLLLAFSAIWFANGVTAIIQARIEHASHQRRKPTRRLRPDGQTPADLPRSLEISQFFAENAVDEFRITLTRPFSADHSAPNACGKTPARRR